MWNRFMIQVRSALLAGVLIFVPLGVTVWVFLTLVRLADGWIRLLPEVVRPETYLGFPIPGLGILLAVVLVALLGAATRLYAGRTVVDWYEGMLARVPLASGIYQGLKQLIQTLTSDRGRHFRKVVLVEYPRRGILCLAFLTNERHFVQVEGLDGNEPLVSIFLPTTPNPTSGFYLLLPRSQVRLLDMTVEEAFKLIMSAGIVTPDQVTSARFLTDEDLELVDGRVIV
ncbi:MAG: DUF502 domain-containing protein, partial [Myxococcota bacterium]|nr:DUF502 domain-containing protein [Myxococcota bacterium]